MSTRSQPASSAGKFETLGSNFSQETPQVATGVLILQFSEVSFSTFQCQSQEQKKRLPIVVCALEANRLLAQENLRDRLKF